MYLVIFIGFLLAALFLKSRDIGDLCVTKENGKDIYYMAIDEGKRQQISSLRRVSFYVRKIV